MQTFFPLPTYTYPTKKYRVGVQQTNNFLRMALRRGGVEGAIAPPSWTNYLKVMQFFTRNLVYTPNFGYKITIFIRFASPV